MKKGEMLNAMLLLAVTHHAGQFDKGGRPYVLHPLKVMHYLKTDDEELQCIAVGHDLIEDTKVTFQDFRDAGISERVIAGITALTKFKGQTYEEYKTAVKSNRDAILVKLCDLRHNTDIRRRTGTSDKDALRIARYFSFYEELEQELKNNT